MGKVIDSACAWAVSIAQDDSHGYDQGSRWGEQGDWDCSSLVIQAYEQAGVQLKECGAGNTFSLRPAALQCGFLDVTGSINLGNGDGLQKGDLILNVSSHVAICVTANPLQIVEASQNEFGGILGGQPGDQTGQEIHVGHYYNFPWNYVLRYDEEASQDNGLPNTSFSNQTGIVLKEDVNYKYLKQYIVTIDRDTPEVDYEELKKASVVGVIIEAGYLYDITHREVYPRNPNVEPQCIHAEQSKIPYGLYWESRARTLDEANKELYELSYIIRKLPPLLGMWIHPIFTQPKSLNDNIVDTYYDKLVKLGLKGKVGFLATKDEIEKIDWKRHSDNWYLWLNKHVSDIKEVDALLEPSFFVIG